MTQDAGESKPLVQTQYESLRFVMKARGWDPELAMEDEGYGIGIQQPQGVRAPTNDEARSLIDLAKKVAHAIRGDLDQSAYTGREGTR